MRFNLLYSYLAKQVCNPTIKAKCRVYMAKDLRVYKYQYQQMMHQILGSYWDPNVQNIAYDALLIKKFFKVVVTLLLIILICYLLI